MFRLSQLSQKWTRLVRDLNISYLVYNMYYHYETVSVISVLKVTKSVDSITKIVISYGKQEILILTLLFHPHLHRTMLILISLTINRMKTQFFTRQIFTSCPIFHYYSYITVYIKERPQGIPLLCIKIYPWFHSLVDSIISISVQHTIEIEKLSIE